jgi:hypothetical protein
MRPGYRYPSGIVFVRELTSFDDAVSAHESGEKICLHLGNDSVGRIMHFFYVPREKDRAIFHKMAQDNHWFVADVPAQALQL